MPWKDGNNLWFNPLFVYSSCVELVKKKGIDQIKKENNYQKLVESYDISLLALVIYAFNNKSHALPFLQMPRKDPPDGYIGQESLIKKGTFSISTIEHTSYNSSRGQSLLDQLLSSKKLGDKYQKYDGLYVLLIKVEEGENPNYEEVTNFLNKKDVKFAVWSLKVISKSPDTVVELNVLNPKLSSSKINVAKIANEYRVRKIPNIVKIIRVGSVKKVRMELDNNLKKYQDKNFGWFQWDRFTICYPSFIEVNISP